MIIHVNNNAQTLHEQAVVADIPELQGKDGKGMAVALNGKLVKKDAWVSTPLKQGDSVLIINAAFGG